MLAAAVGIYLPLELTVPIFLGGLLAHLVERSAGKPHDDPDDDERMHRNGVLFSAGLITGEALMGIVIAIPRREAQERRRAGAAREPAASANGSGWSSSP